MFTVILVVVALADYVITVYCIVSMVAKPTAETEEIPEDNFEGCAIDHINNDYIEEQNARIALLSSNINEILSNIDSIVEGNKVNQRVLVK
jgi:hypothetical protein